MYTRLTRFIGKYKILYNKQFGFRSKHLTLQAVLAITDSIQQAVGKEWYS
jgi:hypothetical protein